MVKRKECFAVEGGDVMFIAEKNMPMAYGSSLSGDRPVNTRPPIHLTEIGNPNPTWDQNTPGHPRTLA